MSNEMDIDESRVKTENLNSADDSFANASAADEELLDEYEDEDEGPRVVIGSSLPVASPFTRPNKFVRQGQGQSQSGQDAAWTTSTSISGASSDSAALGGAYRPTQTQAFLAGSPGTAGSPSSASASAPSASVNAVNAQISRDPYKPVGVNMAQHVFTDGSQPQHLIPGVMEFDPAQLPAPPSGAQGQSGGAAGQTDGDDKPWRRPGADLTAWFNYGFNEESWRVYTQRQLNMRQQRSAASRIRVFDPSAPQNFGPSSSTASAPSAYAPSLGSGGGYSSQQQPFGSAPGPQWSSRPMTMMGQGAPMHSQHLPHQGPYSGQVAPHSEAMAIRPVESVSLPISQLDDGERDRDRERERDRERDRGATISDEKESSKEKDGKEKDGRDKERLESKDKVKSERRRRSSSASPSRGGTGERDRERRRRSRSRSKERRERGDRERGTRSSRR